MAHSSIGLPNDGAGKKLHTYQTDDVNDTHNQVMTLGDPDDADNLQSVDAYGAAFVRFSEGNQIFDSFGKSKMSEETLVGEYMPLYDMIPNRVATVTVGGGNETYVSDESSIRFQTGIADGDLIQRTTHKYHKYFPGTSQLAEFTIALGDSGKTNVIRQWGYYDDENGVIFKVNGQAFELVLRSSITGSVVETVIPQNDFNKDKGDGTGISGLSINPIFANIYWIDLQYLGVGRVRVGAYSPEGQRIVLHEIRNANVIGSAYMTTGSLPLRWEQFNLGIAASTSEMKVLNAAVYTEAQALTTRGKCQSSASLGAMPAPVTTKADGTFDSLVSIRPKPLLGTKTNRCIIIPQHLMIYTDKPLQVSIIANVNNGGTETWEDVRATSIAEKATGLTLIDLGTEDTVFCEMVTAGVTTIDLIPSFDYLRTNLHNNADGSSKTYTILARTFDGTAAAVSAGMTWTELIL